MRPDRLIRAATLAALFTFTSLGAHALSPHEQANKAGKIVEHWDEMQPVPDKMPHANGMV